MKDYETKVSSQKIDESQPFIIRLDGHKFSTFTKPFIKPYDVRCMYSLRKK